MAVMPTAFRRLPGEQSFLRSCSASSPVAESLEPRRLLAATPAPPTLVETDLLANNSAAAAAHTESHLVNPWGLVISPPNAVWISDAGAGTASVLDTTGQPSALPTINIPTPAGVAGPAAPTGVVYNTQVAFQITSGPLSQPSVYLFATEDGTISGWNPAVNPTNAVIAVDHSASGAVYKGLTTAGKKKKLRLYATNFHSGQIEVYDTQFAPVTLPAGRFTDTNIPAGFAPFNVQNVGGKLYVTYAKQDAEAKDDVAGAGNGYVDVFDAQGRLKKRFAGGGALNSPWGVAGVTKKKFGGDIFVGNFGDGAINVFNKNGAVRGQAKASNGQPIAVDGLWGLAAGLGTDKDTIYFTAGTHGETDGLFGKLTLPSVSSANTGGTPSPTPTPTPYPYYP